jgi:hypothetical protein
MDRCEEDWYASDNNLSGTPRGSREKLNAGRAYRLSFDGHGVSWHREERHGQSMASVNQTWLQCVNQMGKTQSKPLKARHGRSMASVNQTRPHCVNQMGKTHSKLAKARHGRSMASVNQRRPHCVNQMGKTHSKVS